MSKLPEYFYEVAFILLREFKDDIVEVDKVNLLLNEINQQRSFKLRQGLHNIGKLQKGNESLEFIK